MSSCVLILFCFAFWLAGWSGSIFQFDFKSLFLPFFHFIDGFFIDFITLLSTLQLKAHFHQIFNNCILFVSKLFQDELKRRRVMLSILSFACLIFTFFLLITLSLFRFLFVFLLLFLHFLFHFF